MSGSQTFSLVSKHYFLFSSYEESSVVGERVCYMRLWVPGVSDSVYGDRSVYHFCKISEEIIGKSL